MNNTISTTAVVPVSEQQEEAEELVLRLSPAKLLKVFVAVHTVEGEGGENHINAYNMLSFAMIDKMDERPDLDIIVQKFSESDYIPARNMGALIVSNLAGQPGKWSKAIKLCKKFARDSAPEVLKNLEESMEFMAYGLKASFGERMDVYQLIFKVQSRTASASSEDLD